MNFVLPFFIAGTDLVAPSQLEHLTGHKGQVQYDEICTTLLPQLCIPYRKVMELWMLLMCTYPTTFSSFSLSLLSPPFFSPVDKVHKRSDSALVMLPLI